MVCERPPAAFGSSPPREGETRAKRARGSLRHYCRTLELLWKDIVLRLRGPRNSRRPCAGPDRVSGKPPRSARIGRRCVGDVVTWPLSKVVSCATRPVDRSAGPTTGGIIREQSTDWERKRFK